MTSGGGDDGLEAAIRLSLQEASGKSSNSGRVPAPSPMDEDEEEVEEGASEEEEEDDPRWQQCYIHRTLRAK